jgi:hypothetical protein
MCRGGLQAVCLHAPSRGLWLRVSAVQGACFLVDGEARDETARLVEVAGLLLLIRQRNTGQDRASLIDSLIIATGLGLLSWIFLIAPYAHDGSLATPAKLTSMAYPLMDLLVLSVAVRLAVGRGNAIKFTPHGGSVSVRTSRLNGSAVLEVEDTRMGIPAGEQEHLFDRFFRTQAGEENATQGSGLGLAISQAIAQAHGGLIEVTSAENAGTTLRVVFPANG